MSIKSIYNVLQKYWNDTTGAIAMVFAITAPVLIGVAGMALDFSEAYLVQQRLQQAIDAAALAATASETDEAAIEAKVREFFEINYPPEKVGFTFDPDVEVQGDDVIVTGEARFYTKFLKVAGIDEIDVDAKTIVRRDVQGIEVVLVLDNTGSMGTNNNIGALKTATRNFIYTLYGIAIPEKSWQDYDYDELEGEMTRNPDFIRIGMVPYSTSVNVGPYGIGKNPDGSNYGPSFVSNPMNLQYQTAHNSRWGGCVMAEGYPDDTLDHDGPWDMYRWCRRSNDDYPICDYSNDCEWVYRNGGWRQVCERDPNRSANYICPRTPIVPITNDIEKLMSAKDNMEANGNTLSNIGMVWGYRVISPEFPFEEGKEYNDPQWKKAVIIMTDGVNQMHGTYSAYGRTNQAGINNNDLDDRLAETCEEMKDKDILIYAVTFASGASDEGTKSLFRNCATSPSQYYHAPDQEDLIDVFETISRELSNLHIKG